jgi:hypothetical protein
LNVENERILSTHKNHFIPFWNIMATAAAEVAIVAVAGAVVAGAGKAASAEAGEAAATEAAAVGELPGQQ